MSKQSSIDVAHLAAVMLQLMPGKSYNYFANLEISHKILVECSKQMFSKYSKDKKYIIQKCFKRNTGNIRKYIGNLDQISNRKLNNFAACISKLNVSVEMLNVSYYSTSFSQS